MNIIDETGIDDIVEISNEEQARNWVQALVEDMMVWRVNCDIKIPNPTEELVKEQQRALWSFLQKHGKVMGALQTLLLTRQINEIAYEELKQKTINALAPTIVGTM